MYFVFFPFLSTLIFLLSITSSFCSFGVSSSFWCWDKLCHLIVVLPGSFI